MNLEVLVATMNQSDHAVLDRMNVQTDAIVVNQCDRNEFEKLERGGRSVRLLSLAERGVGLSRNTALMRATGEICLFADDDVTYLDGYERTILSEFEKNPEADVIVFNMASDDKDRGRRKIKKHRRLRFYNCYRFGACQVAFRLESVRKANICFSLLFGGGARYGSGEDSIFLRDCLRKGLKMYSSPEFIGSVSYEKSTWFRGYTEKYFFDKGVLYRYLFGAWAKPLSLQFVLRHRKTFEKSMPWKSCFGAMLKGIKEAEL